MEIVEVFHQNYNASIEQINQTLKNFNTVTIRTTYPGVLCATPQDASRDDRYNDLRYNVEKTKLILVGITLSDDAGNIGGTWQFTLRDFNPRKYEGDRASLALLTSSGIDFQRNYVKGAKGVELAKWMRYVVNGNRWKLRWVFFNGLYDIGYVLGLMTGANDLPMTTKVFLDVVKWTFGPQVYDLKVVMEGEFGHSGLGLEKLAELVGVKQSSGVAHHAGLESLLAAELFAKVREMGMDLEKYQCCIYEMTEKKLTTTAKAVGCGPSHAQEVSSSGVVQPEAGGGEV